MKKKLWLALTVVGILFVLVGCGSKLPKAEDAVTAMINAEIYDKDDEKYEEYFHIELIDQESVFKELADGFVAEGLDEKLAMELVENLMEKVHENTSFEVVGSDVKDKETTVTVDIHGIDVEAFENNFEALTTEQMLKAFKELGVELDSLDDMENLENVLSNLDEESLNKFVEFSDDDANQQKILTDAIFQAVSELKKSEKASQFEIKLKVNPDNKDAWAIVNHEETIDQLSERFFANN